MTRTKSIYLALLTVLLTPMSANADLIDNGTFDTDLIGWFAFGDISTTWDNGTAHLGRPGTKTKANNGISNFIQSFVIPDGTTAVSVSFDYQWQNNKPAINDIFQAILFYDNTANGNSINLVPKPLVNQGSNDATFLSTVFFDTTILLPNLQPASFANGLFRNAAIFFQLNENNLEVGTRIQLDNVIVQAVDVPEPGTLALLGIGLFGMGLSRRKKV